MARNAAFEALKTLGFLPALEFYGFYRVSAMVLSFKLQALDEFKVFDP
jgi:hypothetical protein